jgi:hypothetical protein
MIIGVGVGVGVGVGDGCDRGNVTLQQTSQADITGRNICLSSTHGIRDTISCSRQRMNDTSMAVVNHLSIYTPQNSAGQVYL